ncbi:FecR family protein [Variovorax sp. W6]|uniref:FecR family protein n=1 Tax=Variovorax sp. W6 TaxID=3093895 RepID=UPI003D802490
MSTTVEPGTTAQVQREAQAWLRRLTSGRATQRDVEGCRRWQATSALHAQAFAEARRLWKALDPAIDQMMAGQPALLAEHRQGTRQQTEHRPVLARRAFLGAAMGAAGAAGVAAVVHPPLGLWPSIGEWRADFRTATGEQRAVVLAEGIDLLLNTQTSVQRRTLDGRTVGIDLITGEAAVDLSSATGASATRPFGVVAGAGRSDAQAGRFEVRYLDGSACVTCIEGSVRVTHATGTARTLQASQQVVYDAASIGEAGGVPGAEVSAWRSGVLVFRGTPLASVVAEINRYRPGRVVLLARGLADRPVSGRFAIASLDTVLVQIQRSYDLGARALPGGVLVLS